MKMVIAINNKRIEEKIIIKYKDLYNIFVLHTKEQIVNTIEDKLEAIIIVRSDIVKENDFINLICDIKEFNNKNRIIVITKDLSKKLKENLFSKEVFNIIEGNNFLFNVLVENIETPKMVVYKNKNDLIKKNNIIMITGSKGNGKTICTKIISKIIAKSRIKRVLVIDLDFIYPSLDLYLNCEKNYSLIDYMNDIENGDLKDISCYESTDNKYNNLKYILNCKSISIPSEELICKILNHLRQVYDYVIVDTSTYMINKIYNLYKEIDFHIVFVINPSLHSIRNFIIDTKYVDNDLMTSTKLIINKNKKDKNFIKYIKDNIPMDIYGIINYTQYINLIDKRGGYIFFKYKLRKLLKSIGIIKFEKLKLEIISRILNIEEE